MPHDAHPAPPGPMIFLTAALALRGAGTLTRQIEALRVALRQTMAARPFAIAAAVVLPDHLHMIWALPAGEADLGPRWDLLGRRFRAVLPEGGAAGTWPAALRTHPVADAAEFTALTRRCWDDPVRHGLVRNAADWPHSSIHRDGGRSTAAPVMTDA